MPSTMNVPQAVVALVPALRACPAPLEQGSYVWLSNKERMSYSACQIG
jgi:hypothetical protein